MRKLVSALALCLAMSLVASPGLAVTNGTPDGDAHPAVGFIVGTLGPEICSGFHQFVGSTGVLIAPDVVLTSAQSSLLWSNALSQGYVDAVWVTFAADPISPDADIDCLTFVPVTNIFTNPVFNPNVFPRHGNVGVMILETPQSITPATLPEENEIQNTPRGQDKLTMVAIGSLTGSTVVELLRRSHMGRTQPPLSDPEIHRVELDPGGSPAQACVGFFENGGGAFVTGTNEILSVIPSQGCTTVSFNQRLDVPSVRNFLDDFVTLP